MLCLARLRRLLFVLPLLGVFLFPLAGCVHTTPAEAAANQYAANQLAAAPTNGNLPDYHLEPTALRKAQHLQTTDTTLTFVGTLWSILQTSLLLWLGVIAWMQRTALRATDGLTEKGRRVAASWAQCFVFLGLYTAVSFLLDLPLSLYGHHLGLSYGLSVQGWASWFGDRAKELLLTWIFGGLLVALLFWIVRKLPRSWWLLFWGLSIPITLLALFVSPYAGFLFNKYEPLDKNHHDLVVKLEEVVKRGHMEIPPSRMYLMKASAKVTTLNADVEGFGSTKRVVVWDNTIAKMTPDEVLGVFGHESGHYVLGHIVEGTIESIVITFFTLWLGYLFVRWAIARYGERWGIRSQGDWGALAVLLLAFSLYGVLIEPLGNALSRQKEHAADVYGQEAIHGIVPDPQASMQGAFDVLGTNSYVVPNPPPFLEFWLDNHPSIGRRAAFAHFYDPWVPGYMPKYFPK